MVHSPTLLEGRISLGGQLAQLPLAKALRDVIRLGRDFHTARPSRTPHVMAVGQRCAPGGQSSRWGEHSSPHVCGVSRCCRRKGLPWHTIGKHGHFRGMGAWIPSPPPVSRRACVSRRIVNRDANVLSTGYTRRQGHLESSTDRTVFGFPSAPVSRYYGIDHFLPVSPWFWGFSLLKVVTVLCGCSIPPAP